MDYIIVQAGGKGTRLEYLTKNKPKAIVPVDNLPMIFHLFKKFPSKRFVIIADYKKEVLRQYLAEFAQVKYQVVDASGTGTCAGVRQAIDLIPNGEPLMLVWSDLILPDTFVLPNEYDNGENPKDNYVGISNTFPCRWSFDGKNFIEERSIEHGVAGFFLFKDKSVIESVPESGELVRWMCENALNFKEISLAGTREFGLLEEYEKLGTEKCRPFNKILIENDVVTKIPVDEQGKNLAIRESAWYEKAKKLKIDALPRIYGTSPLEMEFVDGKNIYECDFNIDKKREILGSLIDSLSILHKSERIPKDSFSIKEAYYNKTMNRLKKVEYLVPFAREPQIVVNGKKCRNVFYHKREVEERVDKLIKNCDEFSFIHGDCTFSNMMVRNSGEPVLIDPRGYFGYSELFGDVRYDWAKVYYSIVGNYDQFNLKRFGLSIGKSADDGVNLSIESNNWEELEEEFFRLTGADKKDIKFLHAIIWLSLTTYAWQDYDSICGAFYNGLWYLEDVL